MADEKQFHVRAFAVSHPGRARSRNEDMVLIDEECQVYVVADGLGGMPAGEVASKVAVETISEVLEDEGCAAIGDLSEVCDEAHEAVKNAGREHGPGGIATTLTVAHLEGRTLKIAHVGDSRAFVLREGGLSPLTREHRAGAARHDLWTLFPEEASPRGPLTRALGQEGRNEVDLATFEVLPGDRFILATDGLTDLVSSAAIERIAGSARDPETCCTRLLEEALVKGGDDNVSVISIHVDPADG